MCRVECCKAESSPTAAQTGDKEKQRERVAERKRREKELQRERGGERAVPRV
jgi:hypothetical protein